MAFSSFATGGFVHTKNELVLLGDEGDRETAWGP